MGLPETNETALCPHCHSRCAFVREPTSINYRHVHTRSDLYDTHCFTASFCRSCGGPIVAYYAHFPDRALPGCASGSTIIYPLKASRAEAPDVVCREDPNLVQDYEEAVACEPHSLQAAIILLARCASQILVAKCDAKRTDGLKAQFGTAIQKGYISGELQEEVEAVRESRNQVGHIWYSSTGEHLKVTEDDVDWWHDILAWMFDQFYVAPKKKADRIARMHARRRQKKEGDKA